MTTHGCPRALLRLTARLAAVLIPLSLSTAALAGIDSVTGLTLTQQATARAIEQVYGSLSQRDDLTSGEQALLTELTQLLHTGNELLNGQTGSQLPYSQSLQLDAEGFGNALQWVAHEELNSAGQLGTNAMASQLSGVTARMQALRLGMAGVTLALTTPSSHSGSVARGGSAGAELVSRWSGFVSGSIGSGEQDPSDNEDAFGFDTDTLTVGVDYRIDDTRVVGIAAGSHDTSLVFDSSKSVVFGDFEQRGWLLTGYGSYTPGDVHIDGSLTLGTATTDASRRINYPSNNPLIDGVDETALSNPDSRQVAASITAGRDWSFGAWTLGPEAALTVSRQTVDGYSERAGKEFNLTVRSQNIESTLASLGTRVSRAISFSRGVIVPQVSLQWFHEFAGAASVDAHFADDVTATFFTVTGNDPDADFAVASAALSLVLTDGLQGFAAYRTPIGLERLSSDAVSGGLRMEF